MRVFLVILIGLLLATAAKSDGIFNPSGGGIGFTDGINNFTASGGPPPACSNKLDFSVACNSQYIGVL